MGIYNYVTSNSPSFSLPLLHSKHILADRRTWAIKSASDPENLHHSNSFFLLWGNCETWINKSWAYLSSVRALQSSLWLSRIHLFVLIRAANHCCFCAMLKKSLPGAHKPIKVWRESAKRTDPSRPWEKCSQTEYSVIYVFFLLTHVVLGRWRHAFFFFSVRSPGLSAACKSRRQSTFEETKKL